MERAEVDQGELRRRLEREVARRSFATGGVHGLLAALCATRERLGDEWTWGAAGLLLILGLWRMGQARQAMRGEARAAGRMKALATVQAVVMVLFLSRALWLAYGSLADELILVAAMAAMAGLTVAMYAPVLWLAVVQGLTYEAPLVAWVVASEGRFGVIGPALVTLHGLVMALSVWGNNRYARHVLETQMRMEAQDRALRQARDEAQGASQARMRFLANMSHEIRTPLNGVLGMTELLQQTANEEQRELVAALGASGQHLARIVNDILDMAKVDSGTIVLERVEFAVRGLVEEVVTPARVQAQEKRLEFGLTLGRLPERARGDAVRLRQVMMNLLNNALKFTDQGSVRLCVGQTEEGRLRVRVEDTGIGLSAEQARRVFEEFHQVDASNTRRNGGTGLGLPISARLVELMGGRLEVESELGRGSAFWFEVELEEVRAERAEEEEEGAGVAGLRVLVAEDNAVNRLVLERLLERMGVVVEFAGNGRLAVERQAARPYDLILMDCQMPEMDGYEAARAIRGLGGAAGRTPILGVTANAFAEDRAQCLAAGMDGHLPKPLSAKELRAAIAGVVRRVEGAGA